MGNLQQMESRVLEIPQHEQSGKKEIHSFEHPTTLCDNLNRTLHFQFFSVKTKIAKVFYNIHFVKAINKKKANKSVLAKNHFSHTIIPISFEATDIIFPFHNFW